MMLTVIVMMMMMMMIMSDRIHVVVQFYPWFKFSFLLFQTNYHVIIMHYRTQNKRKENLNQG